MKRLRRSEVIHGQRAEFSPILFDILFGLLIFTSVEAFFDFKSSTQIAFYLASVFVVLHWWLKYKAADSAYGIDVNDSTLDLLFGIGEIVVLKLALIAAASSDYALSIAYFAAALMLESIWSFIWRFLGEWKRTNHRRIRYLEQELEYILLINLAAASFLVVMVILSPLLTSLNMVYSFIGGYLIYIAATYYYEIIDLKLI